MLTTVPGVCQYLQAFEHNNDEDYAWVYIYDESSEPKLQMEAGGIGIVDITGSDGQEDEVVESAITASQTVGKEGVERWTGLGCIL